MGFNQTMVKLNKHENMKHLKVLFVILTSVIFMLEVFGQVDGEFKDSSFQILQEMVFVQGGTFSMGCTSEQGENCFDWENPSHQVTLSSFNIGKYEVTQAQWKAVMGNNPSCYKGDNLPVEYVTWNDIVGTSGAYMELILNRHHNT